MVKSLPLPRLISLLKQEFPTIRKYDYYAKTIRIAYNLRAIDRASAIPPRRFKEQGIPPHVITQCYTNYDILKVAASAYRFPLIITERVGVEFDNNILRNILKLELSNLRKHLLKDSKVRKFVAKLLKSDENSSVTEIIKNIQRNSQLIKQISRYDRVHSKLEQNNLLVKRYQYKWMGVRFIPSNGYYLSRKSLDIIRKV